MQALYSVQRSEEAPWTNPDMSLPNFKGIQHPQRWLGQSPLVHSNCNSLTTTLTLSCLGLQLEILSLAKLKSRRCVCALEGKGRPRQLVLPHPPRPLPTASTWLLRENCLSLSKQLTITNMSKARSGTLCPTPLFMPWFDAAWTFARLVCDVTTAVGSYAQLPCCVQQTVSLWSSTTSVSYTLFSPSSSMIPEL